ncbi:GntR family transcriptional regulator [Burkholderia stagnalis]|uniref:GntR family transcriptional regulator n=1 Tax=Burkholderia stagnalis TaxID=1503054 RepID=A0A108GNH7_9BURK|nr:GntR family transcriptional regulator [Burkholderia stagnalis]AOK55635.1 GntR family transcriptional regulator [Burkholderia stagnalis]KAB0640133.1 GntR family transcriptional regulator [Burkholderia stagnalis]KVC55426.1 GntR family transcriptional regulator [Burkholderia stagnalis]KVD91776.1 GntR family transcriptional regulator [Burkholderia stagnalis]KVL90935.1 GntR family transcriptional regulator [Burkholderia stagnalis]
MTGKTLTNAESAYEEIRARIFDGRLTPGQKISHRGLAGELGFGQMPVRSALHLLEAEGLVTVVGKSGTFVTSPTNDDLREIFEMRLALESTAAYLAARGGATDGLSEAADRMKRLLEADTGDIMVEQRIGWVFHQELFLAARNPRISTAYELLRVQTLALNELPRGDAETVRRGTIEHLRIYHAIVEKDCELARQHMWNHIVDGTPARIRLIRAQHE